MSATRIWDRFKNLLDVSWGSIADGQTLKRSGTSIIGYTPGGGSGDVVGPAGGVVDGEVASYNSTTGKIIKASAGKLAADLVAGPASATNGRMPAFSGTTGKALVDSGKDAALVVLGPASVTADSNVAIYSGTGGKTLKDSTKLVTDLVTGPASATSGNIATYNGTTGKIIADGAKLATDLVTGPASATSGEVPSYSGATGKLITTSSGKLTADLVTGPAAVVDNELPLYSGTTGKAIKRCGLSGFLKAASNGAATAQTQMGSADIANGAITNVHPATTMITGQTEKTVLADPDDQFLTVDKATGLLRMIRAKWFAGLPRNYLSGMTLVNNVTDGVNDLDVGAGECRDDTNSADLRLNSTITKQLDAAWVAGNNAGGRDTGAIADGSWHVYAIMNPTTAVVDVLFSTSATAPTMPSGFTLKRRIGAVIRVSGTIRAFRQYGDFFEWLAPILDANGGSVGTGASFNQPMANSVPAGIKFECGFNARVVNATTLVGIEFCDPDSSNAGAGTLYNPAANINAACFVVLMTNSSSQIKVVHNGGAGAASYWISVQWYRDLRGQ